MVYIKTYLSKYSRLQTTYNPATFLYLSEREGKGINVASSMAEMLNLEKMN